MPTPEYDTSVDLREYSGVDFVDIVGKVIEGRDPDLKIVGLQLAKILAVREGIPSEELEKYEEKVLGEEITYGTSKMDRNGVQRMRITKDNFYTKLQIGFRHKDKIDDKFTVEREHVLGRGKLPLTIDEFELAKNLINQTPNL